MTLCVAAHANDNGDEHIVLCADWRIETPSISAQTKLKFYPLSGSWCVLTAGDNIAHAEELVARFNAFFKASQKPLGLATLLEDLRQPINEMQVRLANVYTRWAAAIPYERFLRSGATEFTAERRREIEEGLKEYTIKAELILCGPVEGHLCIVRYADGDLTLHEDFACIGSGSGIAEAFMLLREHVQVAPLPETVYKVFEAKKISELAPGVGQSTFMTVMSLVSGSKVTYTWIEPNDFTILETQFRKFAPRKVKNPKVPPSVARIPSELKEQRYRQLTTGDPLPQPPSPESPGESGGV